MKVSIVALLGLFIQSSFGQNLLSNYPSLFQSINIFTICLFIILFVDGIFYHLDGKKKAKATALAEKELASLRSQANQEQNQQQQAALEKDSLEKENQSLRQQLQDASNNLDSSHQEINAINQLLSETKAKVVKHRESEQNLAEKMKSLETALKDSQSKQQSLETQLLEKTQQSTGQEAITLLSLLQQQGRFMDFVMNDISSHPDQQVGAVARVIHQGCSKVMKEFFNITPVETTEEGKTVSVNTEDQLDSIKIHGEFDDQLPIEGKLTHKGWKTTEIKLPKLAKHQGSIIAPAQIET